MDKEEKIPFYLKGNGKNLITDDIVQQFGEKHPELVPYLREHDLKLHTLDWTDFESFCIWIIAQQISVVAAEKIIERFRELVGDVTPANVLTLKDEDLREIGFSGMKVNYVKNVAKFFENGNPIENIDEYTSEDLKKHYTQIKGVGPWTVNMWLIFNLGRLDVLAPKDLAVKKGVQVIFDLDELPNDRQIRDLVDWDELATVGTILSWAVIGG